MALELISFWHSIIVQYLTNRSGNLAPLLYWEGGRKKGGEGKKRKKHIKIFTHSNTFKQTGNLQVIIPILGCLYLIPRKWRQDSHTSHANKIPVCSSFSLELAGQGRNTPKLAKMCQLPLDKRKLRPCLHTQQQAMTCVSCLTPHCLLTDEVTLQWLFISQPPKKLQKFVCYRM